MDGILLIVFRHGQNGVECVLKTLCEVGQRASYAPKESFMAEIVRAIFRFGLITLFKFVQTNIYIQFVSWPDYPIRTTPTRNSIIIIGRPEVQRSALSYLLDVRTAFGRLVSCYSSQ